MNILLQHLFGIEAPSIVDQKNCRLEVWCALVVNSSTTNSCNDDVQLFSDAANRSYDCLFDNLKKVSLLDFPKFKHMINSHKEFKRC